MAEAKLDITDELLVAYVDDELDAAQRAMVSSALDGNPALLRRADEMRLARDLLREAFPLRPDANIPAPIDAAANRLAEACARRAPRSPLAFLFRNRRKYTVAAAVLLSVTAAASYMTWKLASEPAQRPVSTLMRIDSDTTLFGVLESVRSAEVVNVPAEDAAVRAVLTFRAKDGRFCREFEILAGSGGSTGLACRQDGEWRAEVLLSAAGAPPNSNYYTPASGRDEPAIAEVVERLIQGDPLSAQEEARVLASGWRASQIP